ncbi:MAG: WG repeat-containing protein [Oscillospiraceae bacterium]|nr:WG repeat-containing protein [Oscillospiraceae bacterium]
MKKHKRVLSLILALVMAFAIMPTAVLAADFTLTGVTEAKYEQVGKANEGLIAVKLDGKWGFVDMAGKEVIPCRYGSNKNNGPCFSEGLAAVKLDTKWGYIDRTGKEAIPFQYTSAENFSNGIAVVDGGALIDQTGRVLSPERYEVVKSFSEGLAAVRKGNWATGKWGFIDTTGKEVVPCVYKEVSDFSGGLALVVKSDSGCGIIDTTGREVVPCTLPYDAVGIFSEGIAVVGIYVDTGEKDMYGAHIMEGKYGLIDITGKELVPCKYNSIGKFEDGIAVVTLDDAWGLIDTTGKELLRVPGSAPRHGFSEGLAEVQDEMTGLDGYINKWNETVIPFRYSYAGSFSDGAAIIVVPSGKYWSNGESIDYYGIIDKTGKEIVPTGKYYIMELKFSEGFIPVRDEKSKKWGFVDTMGREVIPCRYDNANEFSNGLAAVAIDDGEKDSLGTPLYKWGFVDKTGKEIVPCAYPNFLVMNYPRFSGGFASFRDKNEKWGILAMTVTGTAKENIQTVKVDGKDVSFAMYSPDGGGTNYVRLVDLAVALNGTAGQYNVGYDGRVLLTSHTPYNGGTSSAPFHEPMAYTTLDEPTYVDSVAQDLDAIRFEYQNGGYTYYKLRDLGQALGFNVGWDNANQRIYIESNKPYDPNN